MTANFTFRIGKALLVVCIGGLLAACAAEPSDDIAPIVELETIASAVPTVQALRELPKVNGAQLPTLDPAATTAPRGQPSFGAIIGPAYTQPATETPRPTERPTSTDLPATQPGSAYTTAVPANQARLDRTQMGIQVHYNYDTQGWARILDRIAALRVDWIKLQASWKWLQPNRPGEFERNFRLFQQHVQAADQRGLKVLLSIAKAPDWARNVDRNEDGPPDDLNELHWFIHKLIEQVGPNIDAIELWNEPNLRREWTGRPINGGSYMELFRVGYNAIREFSPSTTVITAALAPTGNSAGATVNDRTFLRQMYGAGLAGLR